MIPGNTIISTPIVGSFEYPNTLPYTKQSQTVMGGVAIGDPSQGRLFQTWVVNLTGTTITVGPTSGGTPFTMTATDALPTSTITLAFDTNMGVALAWTTAAGAKLYYFDSTTSAYATVDYPGVTSCRLAVDDARSFYSSNSDIMFGYVRAGNLYWRQQRDRYQTERLVGATNKTLIRLGRSVANRLQFELR